MANERRRVRYEYWKSNPEQGKQCWTVYRVNAIGQAWSVNTYYEESVAKTAVAVLDGLSEYESVWLHPE